MTPHRKPTSRRVRVDLHAHTRFSPDALTSPHEVVARAREAGLYKIAITDHGRIDGALEAREHDRDLVIVGEEIRCKGRTELIGLFLSERIPMGLAIEEVVERIRDQDGVIYAPHPYAYAWRPGRHLVRALEVADIVEVFNSRAFLPVWNRRAKIAATERDMPCAASSDAHFTWEIGRAFTELPVFHSAVDFLRSAKAARPVGLTTAHPMVHMASAGLKTVRFAMGGARRAPAAERARRTVPAGG